MDIPNDIGSPNNGATLNPSFMIMMDGSVRDSRAEVSAGTAEPSRNLRQRVARMPKDEEATKDVESVESGRMKKGEVAQQNAAYSQGLQSGGGRNQDRDMESFPLNTFSFLLVARYPFCEKAEREYEEGTNNPIPQRKSRNYLCIPFWSALIVLTLQVFIYTLALQNATDFRNYKNPFNFPVDVDLSTRACELVAMMITVYTEDNFFQGVDQFVQSYQVLVETPGVTVGKYYFSATTQVLVGLYGIFVTFIIIMQAEGVVDLLLNFTAMEFVGALDNAAFLLAIRGFFGTPMKKTAKVVKKAEYAPQDVRKWLRKWPLLLAFAALVACFAIVWVMQANRAFGDNEIYVQFHDDVLPWLSTLSGVYIGCNIPSSDISRITKGKNYSLGGTVYTIHPEVDCKDNWEQEHGAFFYCDEKYWVFVVGENKTDPCNKWAMKSVKPKPEDNDVYDIMSHSSELWLAQDPARKSGTGVVEEIQFLAGFKPSQNAGRNCSVLASTGNVFTYPFYTRLDEIQQKSFVSDRPVYLAGDDEKGEYIIYTGRRWAVVKASEIPVCVRNCSNSSTEPCCKFHPYASNYTVSLISDPMDLRRIDDTWIPTDDLIWYKASSGYGNSSKPSIKKQSLVDQINVIEALSSIGAFPTDDERQKLIALHLQSARLSCFCDAEDVECEKQVECGEDETSVWIDLQTDNRPQDTYFVVAGKDTWEALKDAAASDYDFRSVQQYIDDNNTGIAFRNDTGYFKWQEMWNTGFNATSSYLYNTCLPKNKCGFIYIEDSAGNDITLPGRFNVFLNTRKVERDRGSRGGRKCLYDLCNKSSTCSDSSLGSESFNLKVECPDDSLPLAIQFFKDTSLSFSNRSDWLANEEAVESLGRREIGSIDASESFRFDPMREVWDNVDLLLDIDGDPFANDAIYPNRISICLPRATCFILDFEILDVPFKKVLSKDTGFPFEKPIVFFDGTKIGPFDDESTHCIYQFGDGCQTEVVCSDREIPRPYTSNTECGEGQNPLSFVLTTDAYGSETSLLMTDLETWTSGLLTGTETLIEDGNFSWGLLRWGDDLENDDPQEFTFESCVPDDVCSVVVLADSYTDGIVGGGMTLVYDNEEILFGPQGDRFLSCVFQFGDCETQFNCYNTTNPPPPYNPEIQCESGTPLAIDLVSDCCSAGENTVFVTDLDSWNGGLSGGFPFLETQGFFTWDSFQISDFQDKSVSHRFSTCLPAGACGIVAVKDTVRDGLEGGGFTVVYDGTLLGRLPRDTERPEFISCVFQFGDCETEVNCYNITNPPPAYNPEIDCESGTPLAIDFVSDCCSSDENTIFVTDLDSWNQGSPGRFPSLETQGFFTWDSFQISGFEDDGVSHRFSTCMPSGVCGIVAVKDTYGNGIEDGNGSFTVVYDGIEVGRGPLSIEQKALFKECVVQFGACERRMVCS